MGHHGSTRLQGLMDHQGLVDHQGLMGHLGSTDHRDLTDHKVSMGHQATNDFVSRVPLQVLLEEEEVAVGDSSTDLLPEAVGMAAAVAPEWMDLPLTWSLTTGLISSMAGHPLSWGDLLQTTSQLPIGLES